jgi:hypothetical protein
MARPWMCRNTMEKREGKGIDSLGVLKEKGSTGFTQPTGLFYVAQCDLRLHKRV